MAFPERRSGSWLDSLDVSKGLFGTDRDDYELYEADEGFVLTIEMPGFSVEDIDLAWDDGVLNVSAERTDQGKGRRRTYHRRFRFPGAVVEEDIEARYENGVLEVTLPTASPGTARGKTIEIEG